MAMDDTSGLKAALSTKETGPKANARVKALVNIRTAQFTREVSPTMCVTAREVTPLNQKDVAILVTGKTILNMAKEHLPGMTEQSFQDNGKTARVKQAHSSSRTVQHAKYSEFISRREMRG